MSQDAVKEMLTRDDATRQRFHEKLTALREQNKKLAELQRRARIDKDLEKKKPWRERDAAKMAGKDPARALGITVILNLMLRIRKKPRKYWRDSKCRCCGQAKARSLVTTHRYPQDELGAMRARSIEKELIDGLGLGEFL